MLLWYAALLLSIGGPMLVSAAPSPEAASLANTWAPLIWLHTEEDFFPSPVEDFFSHVEVRDNSEQLIQSNPSPSTLPGGEESAQYHLNTLEPLGCPTCYNPSFLHGTDISQNISTYAFFTEYHDACQTLDVTYTSFYPYNRGKDVCIGFETGGQCVGYMESFGNHVSDWEHCSIRFQNGQPTTLYLSVHSFGAFYHWDASKWSFTLSSDQTRRLEPDHVSDPQRLDLLQPNYPLTVAVDGTHPVIFSSNGSHGLWAAEGTHQYMVFPRLQDECDSGHPWKTWNNLHLIQLTPGGVWEATGELSWLNYKGKWGNLKQGCTLEAVVGECLLNSGVTGPDTDTDFPIPPLCPQ